MTDRSLSEYRRRRDLRKSPEPSAGKGRKTGGPIFVIQKHDASNLHYDFRIEVDGVLKSWAVPKGPSTDPRQKRLAEPTEDHPLDYADFEGVIPEGQYGAGSVIVWDRGIYENLGDEPVAEGLEEGHVKIRLDGEKLRGGYALTTFRGDSWLLVKTDDEEVDARRNPVSTEPTSVLSGLTVEEVLADEQEDR